jgi:hypothetical protein
MTDIMKILPNESIELAEKLLVLADKRLADIPERYQNADILEIQKLVKQANSLLKTNDYEYKGLR